MLKGPAYDACRAQEHARTARAMLSEKLVVLVDRKCNEPTMLMLARRSNMHRAAVAVVALW